MGGPRRATSPPAPEKPDFAAGGGEADKPTVRTLWGPKLTPEEVTRAKDRAPQDRNGLLLCWGHLSHMGCGVSGCQRSHEGLKGTFEQLDPAVQMQILKRGGLRRMRVETKESVTIKIGQIRAAVAREKGEKIQDGKNRKNGRASGQGAEAAGEPAADGSSRAGRCGSPDRRWLSGRCRRSSRWTTPRTRTSHPSSRARMERGPMIPTPQREFILEEMSLDFRDLMSEMATFGLGELAREAADYLNAMAEGLKAGSSRMVVRETLWADGPGSVELDGQVWRLWD